MIALAVLTSLLVASPLAPDEKDATKDKKDRKETKITELSLHTPNGWWLHCFPDGSGSVGYGSLPTDSAGFKAGTIDFADAIKRLRKVTDKDGKSGSHFAVAFHEEGSTSTVSVYTRDEKLVVGLYEKAAAKKAAEIRGARFDELWKERPPSLKRD
jgi:hypothetical protein